MFEKMAPKTVFWLYLTSILAALFAVMMLNNSADYDLWGRLAMGASLLQTHQFPYLDPFSYSAFEHPWFDHEWGSGLIFYILLTTFGSASLLWLKLAFLLSTVILVGKTVLIQYDTEKEPSGKNQRLVYFILSLFILLPLMLAAYIATIRCQQFSFLFYAIFMLILERFRLQKSQQWLWFLPILMALWTNLHGGIALGFFLLFSYGLWMLFTQRRREAMALSAVLILCLAATLLNPYGFRFHQYLLSAWSMPRATITEWANVLVAMSSPLGEIYSLGLLFWVGLIAYRILTEKQAALQQHLGAMLLILTTGVEGWLHAKLAPFFILTVLGVGMPLLPAIQLSFKLKLAEAWQKRLTDLVYVLIPAGLLLSALFVSLKTVLQEPHGFQVQVTGHEAAGTIKSTTIYPNGAIAYLQQQHLSGNLWVLFHWGEFALWNLYPQFKVSMDGRYEEVYSNQAFAENERFYGKNPDINLPQQSAADYILAPTSNQKLIAALGTSPVWAMIYRDETAVIYGHKKAGRIQVVQGSSENQTLDHFIGSLSRFNLPDAAR